MKGKSCIIDIQYSKKRNGYYVVYDDECDGIRSCSSHFFTKDEFLYYLKTLFFSAKKYNEIVRFTAYDAKYSNLGECNE